MSISVRAMQASDLMLGLGLSERAGWNQVAADWRRLLDMQPDGCFVAEWQGRPAGTAMTCLFGPVAWIAMVLVEEALRGRGIGKALMRRTLDFLDGRGVGTIRLDATPLGRPLYQRLGFVEQFELVRYQGVLPASASAVDGVESACAEQWPELAALDRSITNTERGRLLQRLFAEYPDDVRLVRHGGRVSGFRASRPGARATQLGPCLGCAEAGPLLLADAFARHAGKYVFLDTPGANAAAGQLVLSRGLTVQRRLTRMYRGQPLCEQRDGLWASAGPEKG